jgi:cob(I)alamin adenosyltransferase
MRQIFLHEKAKFVSALQRLRDKAEEVGAIAIYVIFVGTSVGGTGFSTALMLGQLVRSRFRGIMPVTITGLFTLPATNLETEDQKGAETQLANGNTLMALKEICGTPTFDVVFFYVPRDVDHSVARIPEILRILGVLSFVGFSQEPPPPLDQIIAVADGVHYKIVLLDHLRFGTPVEYASFGERLKHHIDSMLKTVQSKIYQAMGEVANSIEGLKASYVSQISEEQSRIAEFKPKLTNMPRWVKQITDLEARLNEARVTDEDCARRVVKIKDEYDSYVPKLKEIDDGIKGLEEDVATINADVERGIFRPRSYIIPMSQEELKLLEPLDRWKEASIAEIMDKLGRREEIQIYVANRLSGSAVKLLRMSTQLRIKEDAESIMDKKILASASQNLRTLNIPKDIYVIQDEVFRTEMEMLILSMLELESDTEFLLPIIRKWHLDAREFPLEDRITLRISDSLNRRPEEYFMERKIRRGVVPSRFFGEDSWLFED